VCALFALAAWLDSRASGFALPLSTPVHAAAVFGAIMAGLSIVASALSTAASVAVGYLASAVGWLAAHLAALAQGTGAIFAKSWDALKIVWSDALKPALDWVDTNLKRLYTWLRNTFKPVFDFLDDVKKRIDAFYKTFVQPVIDTIEFIRAINRVLMTFHIDFLNDLDHLLQQLEQKIEEPFLWVREWLAKITNVLDRIITIDGFLQQYTLVRSLSRYTPAWVNGFWNRQIDPTRLSGDEYSRTRMYPLDAKWANGKELAQFYRGEGSRMDGHVAALVPIWRIAAGVDPPDGDEDAVLYG
jgi:hypothetical protein